MVQLSFFAEQADSVSQSTAGFSLHEGKASLPLYLFGSQYQSGQAALTDVQSAITTILGNVNTAKADGRLQRTLPVAHPLYPWLYASSINRIFGFGVPYKNPGQSQLEAPAMPNFTAYPNYEFAVEFTNRPYVLAQDASVPLLTSQTFYDTIGTKQTTNIAGEWVRYANWWYERKFDSLTARQGFLRFRAANGGAVNNVHYPDMPRLFLPDSVLHVVWHQVPYRYITSTNSFIDNLLGYVNQNNFTIWKPGELLYIGYTAIPYTPPVQQLDQQYTGQTGYIYSAEKWVDVEFMFLRTKRKIASPGELYGSLSNKNWIQAGWNLLPWLQDRLFHYATTVGASPDTDQSKWNPLFLSTEFGLLFTDPDAPNVYQVPP